MSDNKTLGTSLVMIDLAVASRNAIECAIFGIFGDQDADLNGDNGLDYVSEKAQELGYTSELSYIVENESKKCLKSNNLKTLEDLKSLVNAIWCEVCNFNSDFDSENMLFENIGSVVAISFSANI